MLNKFLSEKILDIENDGLKRFLKDIDCSPTSKIKIQGKELINFSSNNYLDLAGNKILEKKALCIIEKYGLSATSSRLVSGNTLIHKKLEENLALFKSKQACLVYPSGYQTNLGVISALMSYQKDACIIMDKLNHASLWDGAKLSGVRIFVYQHCDMNSLEKVLKRTRNYKFKLVVTESLFSMDGDITPMDEFVNLCQQYEAISTIDEAHSTGIFGDQGKGLANSFGVADKIDIAIGTLSKAFALQGGFVCGSKTLIDFLINKSRAFIYTTAISPFLAAMTIESLKIIKESDNARAHLYNISKILKNKLKDLGLDIGKSESQIIPIITGTIEEAEKLSSQLLKNNIYAPSIKPPTVPKDKARIRVSLTSGHSVKDIDLLINSLK
ncbi:MAG: pyridoxal phosphate-dependent aminotransferase family protein [Endomicrobium sp.]|jgi:8-amino-7-oxononanoate synthase|uniref:aminotransferase class I/II-fold pyridoxal phosphate-dependent enzyme n=1 Tax=Candidatus Endomicrobiellum cubanum TaxID=3242325 RepID=UPI00281E7C5B|nr:pyridoxal phosphate-dependent aminotransferase family protein [Endomicrobium sp.]